MEMERVRSGPGTGRIPEGLLREIAGAARGGEGGAAPAEIRHLDAHSNEVAAVRFEDGRTLMVKRGRYPWAEERFRASRRAAELLRGAGIEAPLPLPLPPGTDGRPLEVYWRVDLPTLEELWPGLDGPEREGALRSWGRLVGRLHRVRLPGFGPLAPAGGGLPSLPDHLGADLSGRLLPAVRGEWKEGVPLVRLLLERLPELDRRVGGRAPILLHDDLHMGNVLCRAGGGEVSCAGLLDLETSTAGVAESDLARLEVMHGPLFTRPVAGDWSARVREGYGAHLEPWALRFFRVYHLLNLGFYSALVGHPVHASEVAEAARREAADLGAPRRARHGSRAGVREIRRGAPACPAGGDSAP